jgi:hypothetical protein
MKKMKTLPALAVPLVNAGRRQNLTTVNTEKIYQIFKNLCDLCVWNLLKRVSIIRSCGVGNEGRREW